MPLHNPRSLDLKTVVFWTVILTSLHPGFDRRVKVSTFGYVTSAAHVGWEVNVFPLAFDELETSEDGQVLLCVQWSQQASLSVVQIFEGRTHDIPHERRESRDTTTVSEDVMHGSLYRG